MTLKENNNYSVPPLNGLVLAGGRSTRMGRDKGLITWHGKEQRYFMSDLLQQFCSEVYISCRPEQLAEIDTSYQALPDKYNDLGPNGGIITALEHNPSHAWLITACDLPLLDKETLQFLIKHRDSSFIATTFQSPHDQLPEPLIAIWEPESLPVLLNFMEKGYKCPRKVLINSSIKQLSAPNPSALMNVNKPEELRLAQTLLNQKR